MTLIISEISRFGIAMLADSATAFMDNASTPKDRDRVENTARKLHVIPHLRAGISIWGEGTIETVSFPRPRDEWLAEFISEHSSVDSLEEFAKRLTDYLRLFCDESDRPSGFHLAGFVEHDGKQMPTIYHIRNTEFINGRYFPHQYEMLQDYPPKVIEIDDPWRLMNGDHEPYAAISSIVEGYVMPILSGRLTELGVPALSLEGRLHYLASWIRFISNLYASSLKVPIIGGDILMLGIQPDGHPLEIRSFS